MSEMMAPFSDMAQPCYDASKLESIMFPDMLQYYDFLPETEIENQSFHRPKLIDNQEELQNNSDQVYFDLNINDIQFSDLLLIPGVSSHDRQDGSQMKFPPVTPENCQNLSEDIFKSYPCLADAMATSFEQPVHENVLSSSYEVHQTPSTLIDLDLVRGNNDVLHDRFKTRSLSVDSAFTNLQEETRRFLTNRIPMPSSYSECTEMHPQSTVSALTLDTIQNSNPPTTHMQSYFKNGNPQGNEFSRNEPQVCPSLTQEKTFEETNPPDSFTDAIYSVQSLAESNHSFNETRISEESALYINGYNENSGEVVSSIDSVVDSTEEFYARSPPEFLLPTTIEPMSSEISSEVSLESLPESLLHLDAVPKATPSVRKAPSRRKRGRKLWEFLLDLLEDPVCNPSLIRWEDKAKGVFRLKEQEIIARKWGKRREKKENLSYDYFARALRYHYKSKMLVSVPERKLVYKFGPKVLSEMK